MSRIAWDAEAWCEELQEWLIKPINQKLFLNDPTRALEGFLKGGQMLPGMVASHFGQLFIWYATKAVAGFQQRDSLACLRQAQRYQLERVRIFLAMHAADKRPRKQSRMEFNDAGLCLARLMALGYSSEAALIANVMFNEVQTGFFSGMESTVAAFVFRLYAKWKGISFSFGADESGCPQVYNELLAKWQTENPGEIESLLIASCDYHQSRSHDHNDEETFEFSDYIDRLYPAEILMILRLRESLSLKSPDLNHPAMSFSMAKLEAPAPFPEDRLLENVVKKIAG
jgi:hypothetical protein